MDDRERTPPPADASHTASHLKLMAVLATAMIIDVMKPASLGFVTQGMVIFGHETRDRDLRELEIRTVRRVREVTE